MSLRRYNVRVVNADLPLRIEVAGLSDVGLIREQNEDALWIDDHMLRDDSESCIVQVPERTNPLMLAVADGVGGAAAGEVASAFVVRHMARVCLDDDAGVITSAGLREEADRVNDLLLLEGERRTEWRGMATTFTAIVFAPSCQCWIHAGDSRLYGVSEGSLSQISRDHTLREISGDMSVPGNIIVNCFGSAPRFYVDTGTLTPSRTELYMLCSDGLSDYADMAAVEQELVKTAADPSRSLSRCAEDLAELARLGGGADNISLILVRPSYA